MEFELLRSKKHTR